MPVVKALGRRRPPDWEHVAKYPLRALLREATVPTFEINDVLGLPRWHRTHDQGYVQGSCCGHGLAMERAITNTQQNILAKLKLYTVRYDPIADWRLAKAIDEFYDTKPDDDNGTSVRAVYDIARDQGMSRVRSVEFDSAGRVVPIYPKPLDPAEGISTNRWAINVDEMRYAIAQKNPVTIGINWYADFDKPEQTGYQEWWIAKSGKLSTNIRGGHCVCVYGASDLKQAFKIKNSWGDDWPEVWIPYEVMQRLLNEEGEAVLVTDR